MQQPLIAGEMNQDRLRAILIWPENILLVNAPLTKIQGAIHSGARTAAEFKDFGLGRWATIRGCPTNAIERMTLHQGSGDLKIWFENEKGKTDTVESCANTPELRENIVRTLGSSLTSRGMTKTVRRASALRQSLWPLFLLGMVVLVGGSLTAMLASGEALELGSDISGYSKSNRRARGFAVILNTLGNLLGFTGCLITTVVLGSVALLFLFSRLRRRPNVLTFQQ